ncbi:unnamed protein product [Kuraishia capsulata CBS 1993]|uniref:PCI domain-containing protein n=1 Tax=Kuraishia capsulata CBS 1993 TaxID=1382522 RepID=W6MSV0_9ASCO|nr:uncharacterized protein KUCA_T00004284001 [Kuraishia capsulata CBS 1993]CDK28302.1 unnamed protein product [Kuraishia capsulata CBS 1993]
MDSADRSFLSDLSYNSYSSLRNEATINETYRNTLEIFAFGSYGDYKANHEKVLELTPAEIIKLRQLTLLSVASGQRTVLFSTIRKELDFQNDAELMITLLAVNNTLISFVMDPEQESIEVIDWASREIFVASQDLPLKLLNVEKVRDIDSLIRRLEKFRNVNVEKASACLKTGSVKSLEGESVSQSEATPGKKRRIPSSG